MKISRNALRRMIQTALNEVSPAWREDPSRRFDVEATPVGHGHYGALNPDKKSPAEVEGAVNPAKEEEFKRFAIDQFDRIFETDFYKKKLADEGGQFDFVADDTITRALSGDIMHGLLHEMLERYIFEVFKEKRMNQPEYDLWTNIMETIVYYLQNGVGGTNPNPFGRWITQRMSETIDLPETIDGDKLYNAFVKVFTSGTADRPGHNQIEEIPEKLRAPFLRNIQKALKKKGSVKPQEAFTQAVSFLINDIHKGGNAKTFLYDVEGNDISDQVMTFYNVLKRKVDQLKKKYPDTKNESAMYALRRAIRESVMLAGHSSEERLKTMKITEKKLRQIIREESRRLMVEARVRIDFEDLKPGLVYELGIPRGSIGNSEFVGWKIEDGAPRMMWRDPGDDYVWAAYLYRGKFSMGSSAEPLKVLRVVPQGAGDIV